MKFVGLLASLSALAIGVFSQPNPGTVTGYTNAHDPAGCKINGTYFVYTTAVGINILTSTDRTAWTLAGRVWPSGLAATNTYTGTSNGNLWAPKCVVSGGKVFLYYAASSFGSQTSAIFLATSSTGRPGSFTDQGIVISSTSANPYNAIDPDLFVENGKWTLTWGSWWNGIYQTSNVDTSTGKITNTAGYVNLSKRSGGIEAPTIYKSGSYYYLFTSWGVCCQGTSSTYNIRVGRSGSVSGPYTDQSGVALTSGGGTLVLGAHGGVYGPGGQDVLTDSDAPALIYHYYTSSGSYLGINLLNFTSGWPVVY